MSLSVLISLVVGGIAGIALLLHLAGRSRLAALTDAAARNAWLRHFPDDRIVRVLVAHDGHAALVETHRGKGLVWAFGDDTVVRPLDAAALHDRADGLEFRFPDYAAPCARVALDADERRAWRAALETR
jgi:hypothetical protein